MEYIITNFSFILLPLLIIIGILSIMNEVLLPQKMTDVKQIINGGIKLFTFIALALIVLIMLIHIVILTN